MRPILLACALLVAVGACRQREEAPAPPPEVQPKADVTPADRAAPLAYDRETEFATVELRLPAAVSAHPDLHATLYGEGVADLRRFLEGAQGEQTEFGGEDAPAFTRTLEWTASGETARLVSLIQTASEYAGGAHPNTTHDAVLWDRLQDRRLEPRALFRPGADFGVLNRALCDAVNAARAARTSEPSELVVGPRADGWACPVALQTPFALAPSTTSGKAGGLMFLIDPYRVGPYAEGSYWLVVPQSAFRALLSPAYAAEFAGEPRRTGDVSELRS